MLPGKKEAQEIACRDRLNLRAQSPNRGVMNARQQPAIAPLIIVDPGIKPSPQVRFGSPAQDLPVDRAEFRSAPDLPTRRPLGLAAARSRVEVEPAARL